MRAAWVAIAIASSAGCLRDTEFRCGTSVDCAGDGTCEASGFCSFVDPACADGRRYGAYAGSYSNQCVSTMAMDDAGIDAMVPIDAPPSSACPATYAALPGAGAHVYKLTSGAAQWSMQRTRCEADGAYLAIPDEAAELMAIVTATAAARTWVGITDSMTEGTYLTVKGNAPGFLPWNTAANEPDNPGNQGGEDCVAALTASPTIATDRCSISFAAICECEP